MAWSNSFAWSKDLSGELLRRELWGLSQENCSAGWLVCWALIGSDCCQAGRAEANHRPATRDLILASPCLITSHLPPYNIVAEEPLLWKLISPLMTKFSVGSSDLWCVLDKLIFRISTWLGHFRILIKFNFVRWCIYTFLPPWTQSLNTSHNTAASFKLSLCTHHPLKLISQLGMSFSTIIS